MNRLTAIALSVAALCAGTGFLILTRADRGISSIKAASAEPFGDGIKLRSGHFAVIGDTQRTLLLERLFLFREQNDEERETLLEDLSEEDPRPDFVALVGDAVSVGGSKAHWRYFDSLFDPIRALGIPVLLALGNHDYWGLGSNALANAYERFPQLSKSHWYDRRYGRIGLIWLDSNQSDLGAEKWESQKAWFAERLARMDADPEIRGSLVFLHHPPYTNSKTTSDEKHVQEAFVPAFLRSPKALAMISGHAHGYERFLIDGKTFVVSGGGGGPRVHHLIGSEQRHFDQYASASDPRPFHYLLVDQDPAGIVIRAKGFREGGEPTLDFDQVRIPFAGSPTPSPPDDAEED